MPQATALGGASGLVEATTQHIELSLLKALPRCFPLGVCPLIVLAEVYGGWWLLPAFLVMSVAGPLDRALGLDGRNTDPAKTSKRHLLWHNLTNDWVVARERLARNRLSAWHYSNPFWRCGLGVAFWYGLAFPMAGSGQFRSLSASV